jgi:hypothetical protein
MLLRNIASRAVRTPAFPTHQSDDRIVLSLTTSLNREHTYQCRHDVYGRELQQHLGRSLRDPAVRIAIKDAATNVRMVEILGGHCR